MKLSYIFSLLPLVAANDGYLFEDRHHLRRALTAESVGESCGHASASAACSSVNCSSNEICATSCSVWADTCPAGDWCARCVPNTQASNDYELMETGDGDGWEDVDGEDYIVEEE